MGLGLHRLAAPGRHLTQAGLQPELVFGKAGQRQAVLQRPVSRFELAAIGLNQPQAAARQHITLQALQRIAGLARGRVVGFHEKDGAAPGLGAGVARVLFQRQVEITQCAGEVVPVLAQHAAQGQQRCAVRGREAAHHRIGVTDVTGIARAPSPDRSSASPAGWRRPRRSASGPGPSAGCSARARCCHRRGWAARSSTSASLAGVRGAACPASASSRPVTARKPPRKDKKFGNNNRSRLQYIALAPISVSIISRVTGDPLCAN